MVQAEKSEAVNELISQNINLARFFAEKWLSSRPWRRNDSDEVHAAALRGLWDAARKFNPSLGFKFKSYAPARIKGAIGDWERFEYGRLGVDSKKSHRPKPYSSEKAMDAGLAALADRRCALRELAGRSVLHNAIRPLKQKAKLIVLLRADGDSIEEIADSVGCSQACVSKVLIDSRVLIQPRLQTA